MTGPGRPAFKPTDEQRTFVRMAVVAGFVHDDIVKAVINPQTNKPIDGDTLRKHFRHELDVAAIDAGVRVVGRLYKNALDGDTTAAIWYTKARLGWKGTDVNEHHGKDGQALIPPTINVHLTPTDASAND